MSQSPSALLRSISVPFLLLLGVTLLSGCDATGSNNNKVTLSGRVLNAATKNPVVEAIVEIRYLQNDEEEKFTVVTDSSGRFSTSIEISNSVEVNFSASKNGVSVQKTERISPDLEKKDVQLELNLGEAEETEPGRPTNITLTNQSADAIRVQESGGVEVARLTFQVVDSTGAPIGLDQAVDVSFRFGKQPGDATLTPETVTTDGEGKATVNVASGKTAGVVQVVAETEKADGTPIRSKPVGLSIHGGLPNKCHFTVAPAQFNFAGLVQFGLTNSITAIVGDKYGNPVIPGTSVYFSTNAGIIDGSVQTGDKGTGSVTLTSANPLPSDGVATIRAETVGTDDINSIVSPNNCSDPANSGNENRIYDTVPVVFSGHPEVEVTPTSAQLNETYQLTIWDTENNLPLAPGTSITVEAEGTNVQATGNTEVTLDDTTIRDENNDGFGSEDVILGEGITEFTFRVVAGNGDKSPAIETISINIKGANGSLEVVLTPSGRGTTSASTLKQTIKASEGASVHKTDSETAVIRAPKDE